MNIKTKEQRAKISIPFRRCEQFIHVLCSFGLITFSREGSLLCLLPIFLAQISKEWEKNTKLPKRLQTDWIFFIDLLLGILFSSYWCLWRVCTRLYSWRGADIGNWAHLLKVTWILAEKLSPKTEILLRRNCPSHPTRNNSVFRNISKFILLFYLSSHEKVFDTAHFFFSSQAATLNFETLPIDWNQVKKSEGQTKLHCMSKI